MHNTEPCTFQDFISKRWDQPIADSKTNAQAVIKALEESITQQDGQKMMFEAKKENVDLQLESIYRQRLSEVHSQVKKRLVCAYCLGRGGFVQTGLCKPTPLIQTSKNPISPLSRPQIVFPFFSPCSDIMRVWVKYLILVHFTSILVQYTPVFI